MTVWYFAGPVTTGQEYIPRGVVDNIPSGRKPGGIPNAPGFHKIYYPPNLFPKCATGNHLVDAGSPAGGGIYDIIQTP